MVEAKPRDRAREVGARVGDLQASRARKGAVSTGAIGMRRRTPLTEDFFAEFRSCIDAIERPHILRISDVREARFVEALGEVGLRRANFEDVQAALDVMRMKEDGTPASAATVNSYVAAVKSLLNFAHQVGYTRFNAAPLIKLKKAPRQLAQKLMSEVDVKLLIRAAKPGRDRLMLEVAYYGALRVSELVSLTWGQLIPRDTGEVRLELVGKGDKARQVLLPAELAKKLLATRCGAPATDLIFKSIRGGAIDEYSFNCVVKGCARQARGGQRSRISSLAASRPYASHALDNGAPISLVSATLGHADLKTTSVYAHAKPGDSSSRYLK